MASIELREITDADRDAVLAIHAGPAEGRFVTSVADSIAEAAESPEGNPWYRAVYLEGEPVGFVMLSWDVTPQPPDIIGPWFLWKLLVDERHQGRGIGRAIVDEVVRLIRAEGATELFTSHVVAEGGPDVFYERLGFVPTGGFDPEGERILRLDLTPRDRSRSDEAVVIVPRSATKTRLRSIFAATTDSMADELIAERRADATRDVGSDA
jgi:diamine N-acetyltransferase